MRVRKQNEQAIVAQCLHLLTLRRVVHWRQNQGALQSVSPTTGRKRYTRFASADGISDIVAIAPGSGKLLAIEVKRPGQKPKPHQEQFLDSVAAGGGLAVCVHSVEELMRYLDSLGEE